MNQTPAVTDLQVDRFSKCILQGGVVVFPTDTVYGLGCDPQNESAIQRLYDLKQRSLAKPSAVMFFQLTTLFKTLAWLPTDLPQTTTALQKLLPGPLTVLVNNHSNYCPTLNSPTLGIRVPSLGPQLAAFAVCQQPVLQTSANLAGQPEAHSISELPTTIRANVDLIIDVGKLTGTPSTVLDLREYEITRRWSILRAGAVGQTDLQAKLGH